MTRATPTLQKLALAPLLWWLTIDSIKTLTWQGL